MPEEINRILVDEITDMYFVTEKSGVDNLLKEGKHSSKVHFVGNTMIDTLVAFDTDIDSKSVMDEYKLVKNNFVLMTMHRPATVDHKDGILKLYDLLVELTKTQCVVFAMHPRTLNNINKFDLKDTFYSLHNLTITGPLDYFSFQNLIHNCKMVITDSGGIQEETTFKQKPCLTLRPNTERPSTIDIGSNTLLDFDKHDILSQIDSILNGTYKKGKIPEFWDGKATERILEILS
jgi:UDP-N-acetylglucosamine 2-epimerase (non-hydrolysing)